MRKDDSTEEVQESNDVESTTEQAASEEHNNNSSSNTEQEEEHPTEIPQSLSEEETYHDAVLGKVSRSKAIRLPTVDRLERKISSSWMFNRNNEKH